MINVKQSGVDEICKILVKRHKAFKGCRVDDHDVVAAAHEFANDVENQLCSGNPACFEISGFHTHNGNPQEFELSPENIDGIVGW